jgi:hypothetical protein
VVGGGLGNSIDEERVPMWRRRGVKRVLQRDLERLGKVAYRSSIT